MTVHLSRYFGIRAKRMPDADGHMWLAFVIWYPRSRKRLGYLYPSLRWL